MGGPQNSDVSGAERIATFHEGWESEINNKYFSKKKVPKMNWDVIQAPNDINIILEQKVRVNTVITNRPGQLLTS